MGGGGSALMMVALKCGIMYLEEDLQQFAIRKLSNFICPMWQKVLAGKQCKMLL